MTKKAYISFLFFVVTAALIFSCKKEPVNTVTPPNDSIPKTTAYIPPVIKDFRTFPTDAANPMTMEGIALGKKLFFDPILSSDSTLSCAGCHKQENSFSDPRSLSLGVDHLPGTRNAMA